jgi:hypothetical protein
MPIFTYGAETWTWIMADIRLMATENRFLRSIGGKTERERIKNERIRENLKLNTLEDKLNNRMRCHAYMLRMNEERIPKMFLYMKVKGNHPEADQGRDGNNRTGKMSYRGKECHLKNLRRGNCRKTDTDGDAWLSDLKWKCLRKKNKNKKQSYLVKVLSSACNTDCYFSLFSCLCRKVLDIYL